MGNRIIALFFTTMLTLLILAISNFAWGQRGIMVVSRWVISVVACVAIVVLPSYAETRNQTSDKNVAVQELLDKGFAQCARGDISIAQKSWANALRMLKGSTSTDKRQADNLVLMGNCLKRHGYEKAALNKFTHALGLYRGIADKPGQEVCIKEIGAISPLAIGILGRYVVTKPRAPDERIKFDEYGHLVPLGTRPLDEQERAAVCVQAPWLSGCKDTHTLRGISTLASFNNGIYVVAQIKNGRRRLYRWSRGDSQLRPIAELPVELPEYKWAHYLGMGPYYSYPQLYSSFDGTYVLLEYSGLHLLNTRNRAWKTTVLGDRPRGYAFLPGSQHFYAITEKRKKRRNTYEVIRFDPINQAFQEIYSFASNQFLSPTTFQELTSLDERIGVFEFSPPDHETIGFVDFADPMNPLHVPGRKHMGQMKSGPRYFSSNGQYVATDDAIWKIPGDSIWNRLRNLINAKSVFRHLGSWNCAGWSPDDKYVAYTSGSGPVTIDIKQGKVEPQDPDYLGESRALVVLDKSGIMVASYTPKPPRIVAFPRWVNSRELAFYDPSRKGFCILNVLNDKAKCIADKILYHQGL